MRKLPAFLVPALMVALLPVLGAFLLSAAEQPKIPAMPAAVTGNAVAGLRNGLDVYSIMGVGPRKTWDDITSKVYVLHLTSAKWVEARPVPGVGGRLGASAVGVKDQIFVFGGYTLDGKGTELTVGDVNSYVPQEKRWYRAADIPVPVDSAVIGFHHDRYIYLVGGRSKDGPVNNVQVYDAEKNVWSVGTPFPGTPVFGHAGGVGDGVIVYVDGAKKGPAGGPAYVPSDECWMGKIDKKDQNKIEWSKLPAHPGTARFGIIAGAGEKDRRILFSGGSAAIHNFKGQDADGKLVPVSPVSFSYDVHSNRWETINDDTYDVRMDSHGILSTPVGPMIIGGMVTNSAVTARAMVLIRKE